MMIVVIRWAVWVSSVAVLPVVFTAAVFAVTARYPAAFEAADALRLCAVVFVAFAVRGFAETRTYLWELRSVTPKPTLAAWGYVWGLCLVFLLTTITLLSSYVAAGHLGYPEYGFIVSLVSAAAAYVVASWFVLNVGEEYERGRKYRSFREISWVSTLDNFFGGRERIFFGGIWVPWGVADRHWFILGVTGSGKSMLIQLIMQCVLMGRIGRKSDERGIYYDNKTEVVPLLAAMQVPYKILHPFDKRCVGLDFPSMVPTHTHSLEIAAILMPQASDVGTDPFWVNAPRNLLAAVMTSLRLGIPHPSGTPTPIEWDFRDVTLAMQSAGRIREIVTRHEQTRHKVEGCFDDPELLANVMETVKTHMMYYEPVAACWRLAEEKINLTKAVAGEETYVLVLGNDEEFRKAIDPINRAILTRYGQVALKRPKATKFRPRRIWFLLDEFPDLKRIDRDVMSGLLTKGRSKGISVLLGVQSILSLIHEYGPEIGKTLPSQCKNIAILGIGDLDDVTAEYAAKVIGQLDRVEERESDAGDWSLGGRRFSESLVTRPVVMASEFTDLPETTYRNGLSGYFRTLNHRGFWGAVLPGKFLEHGLMPEDASVPAFEERDEADHELEPWTPEDLARLGLRPDAERADAPGAKGNGKEAPSDARRRPLIRVMRGGKAALSVEPDSDEETDDDEAKAANDTGFRRRTH